MEISLNNPMTFDLVNCMFSGLLSLFSAVIGLAYPFIIQVRERIQNRYVKDKMVDWFLQERTFRNFLFVLKANIPISILFPYILFICNGHLSLIITFITIQSVFVCALLTFLMQLYGLVNIYSSYIEMTKHTDKNDLERLAIVMLSADNKDEREGFLLAMDKLYGQIVEIISIEKQKEKDEIYEIPTEVIKVIGLVLDASKEQKKYPRTSRNASVISFLYDSFVTKTHLSMKLLNFIWLHLARLVEAKNTVWLKDYWVYSTQFCRNMFYDYKNYTKEVCNQFIEMQLFFSAMVLHSNNLSLMKFIMTFRDATPTKSHLILNSFEDVITDLFYYNDKRKQSWSLVGKYPMFFVANDVNSDDNIFRILCDYLAYSLLTIITNNNGGDSPCFDEHFIENKSKEELEDEKNILEWFRTKVIKDAKHKYGRYFIKESFCKLNKELEKLITIFKYAIDEVDSYDEISIEKLNAMKKAIIIESKKHSLPFKKGIMSGNNVEKVEFVTQVKNQASPGQLLKRHDISCVNFESTLITFLRHQFYSRYASIFIYNGPVHTYLLQYMDLRKAFEKLCFDAEKHILLNNGVSLWNYDFGKIKKDTISIGSMGNSLLILKQEDCPTYTYGVRPNEYNNLDSSMGLYWKEPTKENNLTVDIVQPYIIYNRLHIRYVKINITYDRALGECDLKDLKNIEKIL